MPTPYEHRGMTFDDRNGSHVTATASGTDQDPVVANKQLPVSGLPHMDTSVSKLDLVNLSSQMTGMEILPTNSGGKPAKNNKRVRFNIPEKVDIEDGRTTDCASKRVILKPFKRRKTILIRSKRSLEYCTAPEEVAKRLDTSPTSSEFVKQADKIDGVAAKKKRKTTSEEKPPDLNANNNCNVSQRQHSDARITTVMPSNIHDECTDSLNMNINCSICKSIRPNNLKSLNVNKTNNKPSSKNSYSKTTRRRTVSRSIQARKHKLISVSGPDSCKRYVLGPNKKLIKKLLKGSILNKKSGRYSLQDQRHRETPTLKRFQKPRQQKGKKRKSDNLNTWDDFKCPCIDNKKRSKVQIKRKRRVRKLSHTSKKKLSVSRNRITKKKPQLHKKQTRKKRLGKRSRKIQPIEREEETEDDLRVNLLKFLTIKFANDNKRQKDRRFRCCWRRCWKKWDELDIDEVYADFE